MKIGGATLGAIEGKHGRVLILHRAGYFVHGLEPEILHDLGHDIERHDLEAQAVFLCCPPDCAGPWSLIFCSELSACHVY